MDIEKQEEIRQEMLEEQYKRNRMKTDLTFLMSECGIDRVVDEISDVISKAKVYGFELTYEDIIKYLKEI